MINNSDNILITGGTGFIGTALCAYLVQQGYPVRALVRDLSRAGTLENLATVEKVSGDLLDKDSLLAACAGQDVVVHLAGPAHVSRGTGQARRLIVDGTRQLLEAATQCKLRRLVYISSSLAQAAAAGKGDITAYGRLKYEAEQLLLQASSAGQIEVVILRPVNVYGAGMQGNIAGMITRVANNRLPPLPAVATRLSLVSVTDLVRAIELAITAGQVNGRTYTVTDGETYRIVDIERAIYDGLGRSFPRWRTPRVVLFAAALTAGIAARLRRSGADIGLRTYRNITHDNLFDNAAICRELGFRPGTSFYQELPRIIAKISQNSRV